MAAEDVLINEGSITLQHPVSPTTHVRAIGSDLKAGTRVLRRGEDCTPTALACLAASGVQSVPVCDDPRVVVLAVGNELAALDAAPVPGKMPADNLLLAAGLLRQRGMQHTEAEVCPNSLELVSQRLKATEGMHCVVTTGGTGPGQRDFMLQAAKDAGFKVLFQGIQLHPGKSVFAATRGRTLLFALPGTPWAVFALMHALVLPTACWLRGRSLPVPMPVLARPLLMPQPAPAGWEKLVPCKFSGLKAELQVVPLLDRSRESRLDMLEAQGLLLVPAHVEQGDLLPMIPIWEHRRGHRPF
jgi:molybdopterin molybdotransferase